MSIKRDVLERPFDPSVVRTRRGPSGQTISYVPVEEVIKRLNEAFDAAWDFVIVQHEIRDTEILVLGKLTAGGVTKMAFGEAPITTSRDTGEVVNLGSDVKISASDSLKKAATLFGCPVYSDGLPVTEGRESNGSNGKNGSAGHSGNGTTAGSAAGRLTQRQLSAILAIARRVGITGEQLRQRCTEAYGVVPEFLGRGDASAFIGQLQAESGAGVPVGP